MTRLEKIGQFSGGYKGLARPASMVSNRGVGQEITPGAAAQFRRFSPVQVNENDHPGLRKFKKQCNSARKGAVGGKKEGRTKAQTMGGLTHLHKARDKWNERSWPRACWGGGGFGLKNEKGP